MKMGLCILLIAILKTPDRMVMAEKQNEQPNFIKPDFISQNFLSQFILSQGVLTHLKSQQKKKRPGV